MFATLAACVSTPSEYQHSRYDYWAFRARVGALEEPNYVPWLMHVEKLPRGQRALVACRWPDSAFPLRYHVQPPAIPPSLQDEFNPRDPGEYVRAVQRAFRRWEEVLERPVRFVAVDDPDDAVLHVRLRAEENREAGGHVLGLIHSEADRCRVLGPGRDDDHVRIEFAVREVLLFITDAVGLLMPGQVETIALHEIGHVLGASGQHSPLRGDVMYRIANDRRVEKLSEHDRNSLRSLYRVEPGAVYARTGERHTRPKGVVRRTPPRLGARIEDERFGYALRFPVGWQTIRSPRGWVAVDGLSWDYDASLQVIALRGSVEGYMERQSGRRRAPGVLVSSERMELDGQAMGRLVAQTEERTEIVTVLDWRPGWMLGVVAECPRSDAGLYGPWFWSVILSLEHIELRGGPEKPRAP